VSRTVIIEAVQRFAACVIEITAPPDVLAVRLGARGREVAADVAMRLARSISLPSDVHVETVMNDGSVAEGAARFVAALNRAASDAPQ
jgi:ribose 1,5-bisphosphokinase PhnN